MWLLLPIPKRIAEEAERRGLEVEEVVLRALLDVLKLDPADAAAARLELAERSLGEARELLARGDAVQASEKLYKAAEESIEAMATALGLEEAERAAAQGRWRTALLDSAARRLAERLGKEVLYAWDSAYYLHVEGFHEARLGPEAVAARLDAIEKLYRTAKDVVERRGS